MPRRTHLLEVVVPLVGAKGAEHVWVREGGGGKVRRGRGQRPDEDAAAPNRFLGPKLERRTLDEGPILGRVLQDVHARVQPEDDRRSLEHLLRAESNNVPSQNFLKGRTCCLIMMETIFPNWGSQTM